MTAETSPAGRVRIACPHRGHAHYGKWASILDPGCELPPAQICKLIDRAYRVPASTHPQVG
jgi:hypothetical protein